MGGLWRVVLVDASVPDAASSAADSDAAAAELRTGAPTPHLCYQSPTVAGVRSTRRRAPAAAGVVVRIVPGETRRLCLPFAAAHRDLETFLYVPETGLPDHRRAPEAAAWAFG